MTSLQSVVSERRSLMERLAAIPDVRKPRGLRHPYVTVLTIALAAIAAGCTSLLAIGEWASHLTQEQLATLKAARFKGQYVPPTESTIRRVLQRTDAEALDRVLAAWMAEHGRPEAIACDGKTVRGSGNATTKPRHLVSAVVHGTTAVVAQTAVDEKSNEIPAIYTVLDSLDLRGTLVTADAMHTQRQFAQYVVEEKHADYVLIAKGNQPTLEADIRALDPDDFSPPTETWDKGHGRIEHRRIRTSTVLNAFTAFPYGKHVVLLERTTTKQKTGQVSHETVVGLSSRSPQDLPAEALLAAIRAHWTIENKVHWVRDVDWGEDRSQVRTGAAPHVLATFRNRVLSWMAVHHKTHIASELRRLTWDHAAAIDLVSTAV